MRTRLIPLVALALLVALAPFVHRTPPSVAHAWGQGSQHGDHQKPPPCDQEEQDQDCREHENEQTATPSSATPCHATPTPVCTCATATPTLMATATATATQTPLPPTETATPVPPTSTPVPPTETPVPPTATSPVVSAPPPAATPKVVTIVRYRTIIRHKTVVHEVRRVRVRVRVITRTRHKTVVRYKTVVLIRFTAPPRTGRLAAGSPMPAAPGGRPDARITIPGMGIERAPVWSRGYVADRDGSLRYAIVPQWGLTRFDGSAPFGRPGMTLVYGHDDEYGSIFRFLDGLQTPVRRNPIPFPGSEIQVFTHGHLYRYHVHKMVITSPTDVTWLNKRWTRPTLILVSCYPYQVDTERVLAIAQM